MNLLRFGYVAGPVIGALWTFVMGVCACILVSFATGEGLKPLLLPCLVFGAWLGFVWLPDGGRTRANRIAWSAGLALLPALVFLLMRPAIVGGEETSTLTLVIAWVIFAVASAWPLEVMLRALPFGAATRHERRLLGQPG